MSNLGLLHKTTRLDPLTQSTSEFIWFAYSRVQKSEPFGNQKTRNESDKRNEMNDEV